MSIKDEFESSGCVRVDAGIALNLLAGLRRRMDEALTGVERSATVKLGDDAQAAPLIATAPLCAAFDGLLGPDRWIRPAALEDLRVKFPARAQPASWHVDVFEQGPQTRDDDVLTWRASTRCGGVGLLVLLLLSDVGPDDAATAIRLGSHRAVAKHLSAAGAAGLSLDELLGLGIDAETESAPIILTTGAAGTAFLCHPLLVHTAQANTGAAPSYWALPPIRSQP
jgi:hypothetical protein